MFNSRPRLVDASDLCSRGAPIKTKNYYYLFVCVFYLVKFASPRAVIFIVVLSIFGLPSFDDCDNDEGFDQQEEYHKRIGIGKREWVMHHCSLSHDHPLDRSQKGKRKPRDCPMSHSAHSADTLTPMFVDCVAPSRPPPTPLDCHINVHYVLIFFWYIVIWSFHYIITCFIFHVSRTVLCLFTRCECEIDGRSWNLKFLGKWYGENVTGILCAL